MMSIGLILVSIGAIMVMACLVAGMYSCGGRDCCGERWCIIGILNDWRVLLVVLGVILTTVGVVIE